MIKSILGFVHAYLITALTFYIPVVPDVTRLVMLAADGTRLFKRYGRIDQNGSSFRLNSRVDAYPCRISYSKMKKIPSIK